MKDSKVLASLILAVGLVISASILAPAMKFLGRDIQGAARSVSGGLANSGTRFPSTLSVNLGEIRVKNGGGGGESFRVETATK